MVNRVVFLLFLLTLSVNSYALEWTGITESFAFSSPDQLSMSYTRNFNLEAGMEPEQPYDFSDTYSLDFQALDLSNYVVNITVNENTTGNIKLDSILALDKPITITNSLFLSALGITEGNYDLVFTGKAKDGENYSFTVSAVPLPAAAILFGSALIVLIGFSKKTNLVQQ